MDGIIVPSRTDIETSRSLEGLVSKGLLEELLPAFPDQRYFRFTPRAERLIKLTGKLSVLTGASETGRTGS